MQKTIKIVSVNISEQKGTVKHPCESIVLGPLGVEGDAHAGKWHRQVSMLGVESIQRFQAQSGRDIQYGEFAENITTQGLELFQTHPGDRFVGDEVELEVTQIGKKCHGTACSIFVEVGDCVMPREGIFCRVVKGGKLVPGMELKYFPKEL
jgi:molybdopterin adenylyltransferase